MSTYQDQVKLALAHLRQHEFGKAMAIAEELGPTPNPDTDTLDRASFFELMGALALADGNAQDAFDAFKFMLKYAAQGFEHMADMGSAWNRVAEHYANFGFHEEAIEAYTRAIVFLEDDAPLRIVAYLRLAESQRALGRAVLAADSYLEALTLAESLDNPTVSGFIAYRRAETLVNLATLESIVLSVQAATEDGHIAPEFSDAVAGFSLPEIRYIEQLYRTYDTALRHLEQTDDLELLSRTYALYIAACQVYERPDRRDELLELAEKRLAGTQELAWVLAEKGCTQDAMQQHEQAIETFREARRINREFGKGFGRVDAHLARTLARMGQGDQAREALQNWDSADDSDGDLLMVVFQAFEAMNDERMMAKVNSKIQTTESET